MAAMEPECIGPFRRWLEENGAYINPSIIYVKDDFGTSVYASEDISENSKIVSCPFSMAITPEKAKRSLRSLVSADDSLDEMSERQLLCLYIIVHWILKDRDDTRYSTIFNHLPYLNTLPSVSELRTSLHFNETELELLRGSNLYGATLDRKKNWEAEWTEARQYMSTIHHSDWHNEFTWDRYLTASTYISSRAFPSTLLSSNPSLLTTESSYPVLLPGVDSLNHLRAHQVSWVVDPCPPSRNKPPEGERFLPELEVALVVHHRTPRRQEIFNNYGPKSNAEFILGYGFSIANNNPDDTLVLKIASSPSSQRWEIGRNAKGIQGLWDEMKGILLSMAYEDEEFSETDIRLEAGEMLEIMVQVKIENLPDIPTEPPIGVRPEVFIMIGHYIEGQRDILNSVFDFAQRQQEEVMPKE